MAFWKTLGKILFASGKGFFSAVGFLFSGKRWFYSTAMIFLIVALFTSIQDSITQKSITPLMTGLGNILAVDQQLGVETLNLLSNVSQSGVVGLWHTLGLYFALIGTLWLYFTVLVLLFKFMLYLVGESEKMKATFFTILGFVALQLIYTSWYNQEFYIPVAGAIIFFKAVFTQGLLNPFTERLAESNPYTNTIVSV